MLAVGQDTTGWAITWATYLVGLDTQVQERIHNELDSVFGGETRDFTMDDLRELHYLECVIKETLRLFPSVPFYSRNTEETEFLMGYEVPASCTLVIVPYVSHRDPRNWPNPEVFNPDRFLPENSRHRHPYAYIPFSAGPRNCIGQKFALLEEKAVLASLFRHYKVISLTPRDKLRILPAMVLKSQHPLGVKLEKRKTNSL